MPQRKKNEWVHQQETNLRAHDDDDDDESASAVSQDEEEVNPYSKLMKSITKATTTKEKLMEDGNDDVVSSSSSSSGGDSDNDADFSQGSAMDENNVDNDGDEDEVVVPSVDSFTARFSHEPIPENKVPMIVQDLHETTTTFHYSDSITEQWQVSRRLADQLGWTSSDNDNNNGNNTLSKATMKQQGRRFLQTFYHERLQRNYFNLSSRLQCSQLVPVINSYADLLMTTNHRSSTHTALALHMLNHVLKSRQQIHEHNQQLKRRPETALSVGDDDDDAEVWRDQGFTRPTVLVLLPTRHCCYDFVQLLLTLLHGRRKSSSSTDTTEHADRFTAEYGPPPPAVDDDNDKDDSLQEQHRQKVLRQKGASWNKLFGDDRNHDDDFKIGLQLNLLNHHNNRVKGGKQESANMTFVPANNNKTRTAASSITTTCFVKLYSDFYRSDIILASPLGLKMAVHNNDAEEDGEAKASSADFLSSIEICLVGRADVLWQQNWDHVNDILARLNQPPQSMNQTDFSRVRPYLLVPGQACHWRQLIVTSHFADPVILSSFQRYAVSINGLAKIRRKYPVEDASFSAVLFPNSRQVFQRVQTSSFANASADRLEYFVSKILPQIEKHKQSHTMIFIPSYFDFCSVRNVLLKKQQDGNVGIDFCSVTEYSRVTEVSRGRARFLQGLKPVLLYTGRAHFFLRHAIKGVKHLIFLGLPECAEFYAEHVNRLNEGSTTTNEDSSCLALFTKYDSHALERIVGSGNCKRMVKGEKSTFLFTSS